MGAAWATDAMPQATPTAITIWRTQHKANPDMIFPL
jgi:hypothetical protein